MHSLSWSGLYFLYRIQFHTGVIATLAPHCVRCSAGVSALRQKMIEDMELHGFAERTQEAYLNAVRQLAKHYRKSPDQLEEDELRQYFLFLKNEKQAARATCPVQTLGSPVWPAHAPPTNPASDALSFSMRRLRFPHFDPLLRPPACLGTSPPRFFTPCSARP
jgi:hypothetical protein